MKKFKIYILALSLLGMGACSDFLDSEPITELTDANFYRTPNDAFMALVGCYDGLQRVYANGIAFPIASEVFSDNCFGGTGNADGFGYQAIDEFDRLRSPADQNLFEGNWIQYYRALYRINVLLGKLDQVEWGNDDNLKPIYEAEAKFIRAYLYFDMVRLWGGVPLVTAPTRENLKRAEPAEIFKLIAEDLKFAAENLPSTSYASQAPATYGRVTKWAAEALIGRVYLFYTGYYQASDLAGVITQQQALAYLEDVIQNGGFGLVEDFDELWPASAAAAGKQYVGENNKETVFAIKYTYTSNYNGATDGNHYMVMFGIRERSFPQFRYGRGWGGATVNPKLWEAYQTSDARRFASIIAISEEGIPFDNHAGQREYTGYYVKKYAPMVDEDGNDLPVTHGGTNFMIGQFQDYVAIRYADVLLMAAELGSVNAQQYFNAVRQRAYGSNPPALAFNLQNLMNERRLEFAFEGIRYWDLLRQGINVAANTIAESTSVLNGGVSSTKTISASNIVKTKGLQQIPFNQITLSNGVLVQNEGW